MEHLISLEDPFKYHNENYFSKLKNNTSRLYITSQNYIRRFVKKVYIERDPFVKYKPNLIQKERGFLSLEELRKIEDLQPELPRLQKVRDLFIFRCYTGISYGDLMLLSPQNLTIGIDKKFWIITKREKNGYQVKLPLLSKAVILVEK